MRLQKELNKIVELGFSIQALMKADPKPEKAPVYGYIARIAAG
jgi:hypothetical protein